MRRVVFVLGVLLAMSLWAGELRATNQELANLQQLTQGAEMIVVGRCIAIKSAWDAQRMRISTYVSYDVEETIKGGLRDQQIVVKTLGGTVGSITQMMVGGPTFEVGERALLFLTASDEPATFRIQGLRRGKLEIYSDTRTGERFLRRETPSAPRTEPLLQALQQIQLYLEKPLEK